MFSLVEMAIMLNMLCAALAVIAPLAALFRGFRVAAFTAFALTAATFLLAVAAGLLFKLSGVSSEEGNVLLFMLIATSIALLSGAIWAVAWVLVRLIRGTFEN